MKRLIIAASIVIAALVAPTAAHAAPQTGGWKWTPACYIVPATKSFLTTDLRICRRLQSPIFYVWVWKL